MRAVRSSAQGIETREVEPDPLPSGSAGGDAGADAGARGSAAGGRLGGAEEWVRVRTRSASICQTDVNLAALDALPFTLGHEFAGLLDDGTPVGVEPLATCGVCTACRRNDRHFCERGHAMVIGVGRNGGMADEVLVPRRALVALPTSLDVRDACLIEPLAVHLHAFVLGRLEPAQRVCVVGANISGFGLLGAVAAQDRGCTVDFEETAPHALAAAERLGIGIRPSEGYDLVVEADGSEEAIARAAELCRPGGTVLLVAGYYSEFKRLRMLPFVAKELTVVFGTWYGHHAAGRDVESAAALLARRPEIARAVISHRFPLAAAREAFALVRSQTPSLKVVLEP